MSLKSNEVVAKSPPVCSNYPTGAGAATGITKDNFHPFKFFQNIFSIQGV